MTFTFVGGKASTEETVICHSWNIHKHVTCCAHHGQSWQRGMREEFWSFSSVGHKTSRNVCVCVCVCVLAGGSEQTYVAVHFIFDL